MEESELTIRVGVVNDLMSMWEIEIEFLSVKESVLTCFFVGRSVVTWF